MDGFELINVVTQKRCKLLPKYPVSAYGATASFYREHIVVCGGTIMEDRETQVTTETDSCHKFNFLDNVWADFGQMLISASNAKSGVMNDLLWITGGTSASQTQSDTQYFVEDQNGFTFGQQMPIHAQKHCFVQINSTHVFLSDISGSSPSPNQFSTFLINWETREYQSLDQVPNQRILAGCGLTWTEEKGIEIVVVGNKEEDDEDGTCDIFSLSTMSWREGPVMEHNAFGAAIVPLGNSFVMTGGKRRQSNSGNYSDAVIRYDAEKEMFYELNVTLGIARAFHMALSIPDDKFNCPGETKCLYCVRYSWYSTFVYKQNQKILLMPIATQILQFGFYLQKDNAQIIGLGLVIAAI